MLVTEGCAACHVENEFILNFSNKSRLHRVVFHSKLSVAKEIADRDLELIVEEFNDIPLPGNGRVLQK